MLTSTSSLELNVLSFDLIDFFVVNMVSPSSDLNVIWQRRKLGLPF